MTETQELVARIHALASRTARKPSTISRMVLGNGDRIAEIERGGSLTLAVYGRALRLLDELEAQADRKSAA